MPISIVNRYKQMLSTIPKGSFYDSDGQVLPFRGELPYELRISTGVASRQYGVYVNDNFATFVTTNVSGIALLTIKLAKGRSDIRLVDSIDLSSTITYITTRDYATMLASEAQIIETIDTGIEQVLLDSYLATSSASLIEQVFGRTVATSNDFGLDLDTYRELLGELRNAYRYWGGTVEGISRVVRAFTGVSPLIYPVGFGPVWILGKDLLSPKNSTVSRSYYTNSTLTNINTGGAGVSVTSIENTVGTGTGTLKLYAGAPKTLTWIAPTLGAEGPTVNVIDDGEYTLLSGTSIDPIVGLQGPYNQTAANNILSLDVDGKGIIPITLTIGAAVSAATNATTINAAFVADLRYGGSYSAVADAYNDFGAVNPLLRLTTPNWNLDTGSIKIVPNATGAAQTIFNVPVVRGGLAADYAIGVSTLVLSATTLIDLWPDPTVPNPIYAIVGGTTYHPAGAPNTAAMLTVPELVSVVDIDKATKTLTLASPLTIAHTTKELIVLQGEWPYRRETVPASRSITINIDDVSLLPAGPTTDSVVIAGSAAPNGWIVTSNAGAAVTPTGRALHVHFDLERDLPFDLNANGMVCIPVPDEILKYKGFDVNFAVYGRVDDPSRAAAQSTIATIGVSFDNQATYTDVAPVVSGIDVNALNRPQEFLSVVRIDPDATKVWMRVKLAGAGVGNFTIHKVRVTAAPTHDGLFLGSGTTPRGESKIKQGSFLYCWSPEALTAYEDASLGLTNITQVNPGHIDKIAPAEAWLEKFDVSEYSGSTALNVKGVFNETDLIAGTMTNVDMVLRTPPRFSHLVPTLVSDVEQTVVFSAFPAYVGALTVESDQDLTTSVLFQDGVPLTQDEWGYNSALEIELVNAPAGPSTYTFTYKALVRFESATIDLSTTFADYLWFADYHNWLRPEIESINTLIKTGIVFNSVGVSTLPERSNKDKSVAQLTEDLGLVVNIIPANQWKFLDERRIQLDATVLNPAGVYELKYMSENNHPRADVAVLVELKSATTVPGLVGASYATVTPNQVIDGSLRYHQMRVTVSNIRDIRDIRIQSLVLKGLNMFGVSGMVPILRP